MSMKTRFILFILLAATLAGFKAAAQTPGIHSARKGDLGNNSLVVTNLGFEIVRPTELWDTNAPTFYRAATAAGGVTVNQAIGKWSYTVTQPIVVDGVTVRAAGTYEAKSLPYPMSTGGDDFILMPLEGAPRTNLYWWADGAELVETGRPDHNPNALFHVLEGNGGTTGRIELRCTVTRSQTGTLFYLTQADKQKLSVALTNGQDGPIMMGQIQIIANGNVGIGGAPTPATGWPLTVTGSTRFDGWVYVGAMILSDSFVYNAAGYSFRTFKGADVVDALAWDSQCNISIPNGTLTVASTNTAAVFKSATSILQPSGAPADPAPGQTYFSSTDAHFWGWDGTAWKQLDN